MMLSRSGVATGPGQTQLTRKPSRVWSMARARVSWSTPPFEAQYAAISEAPTMASSDPTLTIVQPPSCAEAANGFAAAEEGAGEVDVDHASPLRKRRLGRRLRELDAGAVHEHVDAPMRLEDVLEEGRHRALVGDVDLGLHGGEARRAQGGGRLGGRRPAHVGQHHDGALLREARAVARPIPEAAPVTMHTLSCSRMAVSRSLVVLARERPLSDRATIRRAAGAHPLLPIADSDAGAAVSPARGARPAWCRRGLILRPFPPSGGLRFARRERRSQVAGRLPEHRPSRPLSRDSRACRTARGQARAARERHLVRRRRGRDPLRTRAAHVRRRPERRVAGHDGCRTSSSTSPRATTTGCRGRPSR